MSFRLEAVIVCVDYADYLAETLLRNRPHFDNVIVVTSKADKETQEVARRLSVKYFATDVMYRDGGPFNKAAAIQFGLSHVAQGSWVVHLDADTYLPPMTRQFLKQRLTDKQCIYGIDRVNCVGWDRWRRFIADPHPGHDYCCRVPVPDAMPLCDRIVLPNEGWVPIGFFQAWHTDTKRRYPTSHQADGERTDVLHAQQWEPHERVLIPEILSVHLMADNCKLGANWRGRTTPRFESPRS